MVGFILAAGFGTRLKPITEHIPKALVPVCGIPLLERNIHSLYSQNITTLGVNSHYLHDQLQEFQNVSDVKFELFYEPEILGTGGALYNARDFLSMQDIFCIYNVDILSALNFSELEKQFLATDWIAALVVTKVKTKPTVFYEPTSMHFKCVAKSENRNANWFGADFIGIALYKKEMLEFVKIDDFSVLDIWDRIIQSGMNIGVLETDSFWYDIGTLKSFAAIHADVLSGKIKIPVPQENLLNTSCQVYSSVTSSTTRKIGPNVWNEISSLPENCEIKNSIILKDSIVKDYEILDNLVVSKWGRLSLG